MIRPSVGWKHVVLNYYIDTPENRFEVLIDGLGGTVLKDNTGATASKAKDISVVIGRLYPNRDIGYASVQMDELTFWDRTLTDAEIQMLASQYTAPVKDP